MNSELQYPLEKFIAHIIKLIVVVAMAFIGGCRTVGPLADVQRTPSLWSILGTSVEQRPIYCYEHGTGDSVVLVFGCTHGDEQVSGQVVIRLAESLAQQKVDLNQTKIMIIPILNPDGVFSGTRTNANGVDINRNFPTKNWTPVAAKLRYFPGPSPSSEPETRLALELLSRYKPRLIITIHSALHMINYDGPAKEIAERMAKHNGYFVSDSIGYPTPGSLGTYAGVERNIPTITLELPAVEVEEAWQQNREALLEVLVR